MRVCIQFIRLHSIRWGIIHENELFQIIRELKIEWLLNVTYFNSDLYTVVFRRGKTMLQSIQNTCTDGLFSGLGPPPQ